MSFLMIKDLPRYECLLAAAQRFRDLEPSACEAYLNVLRAGDEVYRQSEAFFAERGLSRGRFTLLMLLYDKSTGEPVPLSPAELADKVGVARATITGLLDTLEKDGYVTREHDSGDRRMTRIHLTDKGKQALEDILPLHFRRMATLMAPLSEDERTTLVGLLDKIAARAASMAGEEHATVAHADTA